MSGGGGGSLLLATLSLRSFFPSLQSATINRQQSDQLGGDEATGAARRGGSRSEVRGRERLGGSRTAVGGALGSGEAGSRAEGGGRGRRRRRARRAGGEGVTRLA